MKQAKSFRKSRAVSTDFDDLKETSSRMTLDSKKKTVNRTHRREMKLQCEQFAECSVSSIGEILSIRENNCQCSTLSVPNAVRRWCTHRPHQDGESFWRYGSLCTDPSVYTYVRCIRESVIRSACMPVLWFLPRPNNVRRTVWRK